MYFKMYNPGETLSVLKVFASVSVTVLHFVLYVCHYTE